MSLKGEIIKKEVKLPSEAQVSVIDYNCVVINLKAINVSYKLKNAFIKFTFTKKDNKLIAEYLNKDKKHAENSLKVWSKKLYTFDKKTEYSYTITAMYKHFPIMLSLERINDSSYNLKISNFLGNITDFFVLFTKISSITMVDKKIILNSYDDITTGSEIENLAKLRYKTNLKTLDKTRFTDGFFVEKTIISNE